MVLSDRVVFERGNSESIYLPNFQPKKCCQTVKRVKIRVFHLHLGNGEEVFEILSRNWGGGGRMGRLKKS